MTKRRQESNTSDKSIVYVRLNTEDLAELKRREATTGAPVSAQVRILVQEALRGKRVIR